MTDEAKKVDWETERKLDEVKRHVKGLRITTFVTLFIALFGIGMGLMIRQSFDAPLDSVVHEAFQKDLAALEAKLGGKVDAVAAKVDSGHSLRGQLGSALNTLEALSGSADPDVKAAATEAGKALEKLVQTLNQKGA